MADASYAVIIVNLPIIVLGVKIVEKFTDILCPDAEAYVSAFMILSLVVVAVYAGILVNRFLEARANAAVEIALRRLVRAINEVKLKLIPR